MHDNRDAYILQQWKTLPKTEPYTGHCDVIDSELEVLNMDNNCIFCKLANHVFDTNIIYEDDEFTVILDAGPATRGHALILPKEHHADIYEMPDELLEKAIVLAKKVVIALRRSSTSIST